MRSLGANRVALLTVLSLWLMLPAQAQAQALTLSYSDPVEDHLQLAPVRQLNPPPSAGIADLVGLVFNFDNATGDYEIVLTASPANPFIGSVRFNVQLFNPDTGTTAQDPAFFRDLLNDFSLNTPTTTIRLTGSDPKLLAWQAGDQVAPCHGATFQELGPCQGTLGLPDGILGFGTGSINLDPSTGRDGFRTSLPAIIVRNPSVVEIDIKPGSDPNCFNINEQGVIPVAILGSDIHDVSDIDQSTLSFAGLEVRVRGNKGPLCDPDYSNGDEYLDLICHFEDDPNMWNAGSSGQASLFGNLLDGTEITGTDTICIAP